MKIAIIGPGAVGKTTVIKELEKDLKNYHFSYERTEIINDKFSEYMNDMKQYAFVFQKEIFAIRKKEILKNQNKSKTIIDRHLIDDFIFPKIHQMFGNFTQEQNIEWKKIEEGYIAFLKSIPKIDIVFLLICDDDMIEKRRSSRSKNEEFRKFEIKNKEFFQEVNKEYQSEEFKKFISLYSKETIIIKNVDSLETSKKIGKFILNKN